MPPTMQRPATRWNPPPKYRWVWLMFPALAVLFATVAVIAANA